MCYRKCRKTHRTRPTILLEASVASLYQYVIPALTDRGLRIPRLCGIRVRFETGRHIFLKVKHVETAELKSAISELMARVEKIRDWL